MDPYSFLGNADQAYTDEQYTLYLKDPMLVDPLLRKFFEGFDFAQRLYPGKPLSATETPLEFRVLHLINAYRERGHYFTRTNPVRTRRKFFPTLDIVNFGLEEKHLDQRFHAGKELGIGEATLKQIIDFLQQTYCHSIGVEFMYIRNVEVVNWIRSRMEGDRNIPNFTRKIRHHILDSISRAVGFEKFVHKAFPGYKSFSLAGAESLIPALETLIEQAAMMDYKDMVIGMAHRGRLNVLANIMHKPYGDIFREFAGVEYQENYILGDVKYHLGYSSDRILLNDQKIHLSLSPNPSHLEAVDPVVEGIARAFIDRNHKGNMKKVLPVLIHGDASIAGQGIIYELLQMSELPAYRTGGTIHFVINNQLGFTTNFADARSSIYCTDVAKIVQSPIFHVNGDDVEAVAHTALLALDFRDRFGKDVFIDLLCYRRYGHNESDEPRFTQPLLYKAIENHPDPMTIYLDKLLSESVITPAESETLRDEFNKQLEQGLFQSKKSHLSTISNFLSDQCRELRAAEDKDFLISPETAVSPETLNDIGHKIASLPEGTSFFRKILGIQNERQAMITNGKIDWAMAELLAFGTLLNEGFPVRMSGQDVERGTFSQRHAVLKIEDSEEELIPLQAIGNGLAQFEIYNSLLSEYGVLGFEYGYALARPNGLTLWEAQFGDFSNGAQIIIDQFICAAEEKWNIWNGLVMLLPHGYEGQGPDHSNAGINRFLSMCAMNNIQVANCSTPANYFHLLRRQLHRPFRKPLIIFTPKSLLRHPSCLSSPDEFTRGGFQEVIDDIIAVKKNLKRVIFCSGKIYYELDQARQQMNNTETAIVRIEQLYPFPLEQIRPVIQFYSNVKEWLWVQEEPVNMGAWAFITRHLRDLPLLLVARPESGSPATGSSGLHKIRQKKIIEKAFGQCDCERRTEECRMRCAPGEWNFINTQI